MSVPSPPRGSSSYACPPCRGVRGISFALLLALVVSTAAVAAGSGAEGPADRSATARWVAPRVDLGTLLEEDRRNRGRKDVPRRVGFPMKTDLTPSNSGKWTADDGGDRIWRLRLESPDALWIVVGFSEFRLQRGAELFVRGLERREVHGPFTASDVRPHGQLWLPPIEGQDLELELRWPASLGDAEPVLRLGTVSHGYRSWGGIGAEKEALGGLSGACNNDVQCPEGLGWEDPVRSVVRILTSGFGVCTGALINNTANDCSPLILSAAHCNINPASLTVQFDYQNSVCGGGTVETSRILTGSTRLGRSSTTDFDLLRLDDSPPEAWDVHFSGWNRGTAPASRSTCIHHPNGDVKKISHDLDALTDGRFTGGGWGPTHWRVGQWEDGTTEPSSSGAPLYDQNKRIVGQLHGGTASCGSISWDEFGKFDGSWTGDGTDTTSLAAWLDPEGTGAETLDGIDATFCLESRPDLAIVALPVEESIGNGNAVAEPGETLTLAPIASNDGNSAASNVTGVVSTTHAGVTLTDTALAWPDLPAGESAASIGAVTVELDDAFTCGTPVPLRIELMADEGQWSDETSLPTGTLLGRETVVEDDIEDGADGWTPQNLIGTNSWFRSGAYSHSPVRSWFVNNIISRSDSVLVLDTLPVIGPATTLSFWHRMESEAGYDGGVLEFSTDGSTWFDGADAIIQGGYNLSINTNFASPLAGRLAWSGNTQGWKEVRADLSAYTGMSLTLRWRFATDTDISAIGWFIDDVVVEQGDFECEVPVAPPGEAAAGDRDSQLRIDRTADGYVLSWGTPQSGGPVSEYALYSRDFTPRRTSPVCQGLFGQTTATVADLPDDQAFLIVARNAGGEGSYGTGRPRVARPVSSNPCE